MGYSKQARTSSLPGISSLAALVNILSIVRTNQSQSLCPRASVLIKQAEHVDS